MAHPLHRLDGAVEPPPGGGVGFVELITVQHTFAVALQGLGCRFISKTPLLWARLIHLASESRLSAHHGMSDQPRNRCMSSWALRSGSASSNQLSQPRSRSSCNYFISRLAKRAVLSYDDP